MENLSKNNDCLKNDVKIIPQILIEDIHEIDQKGPQTVTYDVEQKSTDYINVKNPKCTQ